MAYFINCNIITCPGVGLLKTLYYSFIRPRLLYGVDIYVNTYKSFKKRANSIE